MGNSETLELLLLRAFFSPATSRIAGALVKPEHMSDDGRRAVAETLAAMARREEPITTESVALQLQADHEDSPQVAGDRIAQVMAEEPPDEPHLLALVRSTARNADRKARAKLAEWLSSDEGLRAPADTVMSKLADYTRLSATVRPDDLQSSLVGIRGLLEREGPAKSYSFGFGRMDDVYRIYPGSFNLVLADSGVGKTALMLNMATNLAAAGTNAYVFSVEMDKDSVNARIAAMASGVTSYRIDDNDLSTIERQQLESTIWDNKRTFERIYVADPSSLMADALHPMIIRAAANHGDGVAFIDYLQLVDAVGRHITNETSMQAQVSKTLTMIAKSTRIPIVALSQVTTTNSGMDLVKGSKQAKHDGWTMLLVERSAEEPEGAEQVILSASVLKNRKRPNRRRFSLIYNLRTQRIFYSDEVRTQDQLS